MESGVVNFWRFWGFWVVFGGGLERVLVDWREAYFSLPQYWTAVESSRLSFFAARVHVAGKRKWAGSVWREVEGLDFVCLFLGVLDLVGSFSGDFSRLFLGVFVILWVCLCYGWRSGMESMRSRLIIDNKVVERRWMAFFRWFRKGLEKG